MAKYYIVILQTADDVRPIYVGKSLKKAEKIYDKYTAEYSVEQDQNEDKPFGLVYLSPYTNKKEGNK